MGSDQASLVSGVSESYDLRKTGGAVMWNWLLVKLGLRTDWSNPDNAPPGLSDDEEPHDFSPFEGVPCCGRCGGGRLHSVHHGVPYHRIRKRVKFSEVRSGEGDET